MGTKAYCLADFILCCINDQKNVMIFKDAERDAQIQFGLNTKAELLGFIGNQGLQDLMYWNTELWRLNPRNGKDIFIDAYKFRSNQKTGYIAFMKGFTCKYAIKSFHLDHNKTSLKGMSINAGKLLKDGI